MNALQRAGIVAVACAVLVAACAPAPHVLTPGTSSLDGGSLSALLAAHPLAEGQNISALLLGKTDALSYHLVQIRDREQPHLHATHDLVVTLVGGSGQLHVGGDAQAMRAGDVAVIPRGTPHFFVNAGDAPAASFATFAPPYDGSDQVPVGPH